MLGQVKGEQVVLCDVCGGVISWQLDHNLKYGYICTNCIDKDFGKFRVLDLYRYELERLGVNPDILSDKNMSNISKELSHRVLLGEYWNHLQHIIHDFKLV